MIDTQRRGWILAAYFYFAMLVYIFFLGGRRIHEFYWGKRSLKLVPFRNKILYYSPSFQATPAYRMIFYSDLIGNILLFIPFAIFLVIAFNVKKLKKVFLISLITSISIESIQYIFRLGTADIDDVILNTTGALIGIAFIKLIQKINLPFIDKRLYMLN